MRLGLSQFLALILLIGGVFAQEPSTLVLTPEEKAWLDSHREIRIGVTPDWPPFEFIDAEGKYQGLAADLLRLVADELNLTITMVSTRDPWDQVMERFRKGEIDLLPSIFVDEERKSFVAFSEPFVEVAHVVIVREGAIPPRSFEELRGKKLAYMRGWVCQSRLAREYPDISLSLNDRVEGMIGQVLMGTADAGLVDLASLGFYSRIHHLQGLQVAFQTSYSYPLAVGFRKDFPELRHLFGKVLASVAPERLARIREKWIAPPRNDPEVRRWIYRLSSLILILLLGGVFWNQRLRRLMTLQSRDLERETAENRRRAEALVESELRFRAVFDQTFQFIGLLSPEGVLLQCNLTARDLIGVTREQVEGRLFWETPWWTHSSTMQEQLRVAIAQAAQGVLFRFEASHCAADGNDVWIDFSVKPFFDEQKTVRFLIAEGRDITFVRNSRVALQESEERFRTLFDGSPDPCWLIQGSLFIECNLAAIRILGYPSKEALLRVHPSKLSPECQSDGTPSFEKAEAMMKRAAAEGVFRFEWEHLRFDGSVFPVEVTLAVVTLHGREALYCIWRDISERRRHEKEREKLEAQFMQSQKMESIGRLAGGIAHDFNNLLTAINGFTELVMSDPKLPESSRTMLQEVARAGESATALTRQLLAFSRKQMIEPRILDLNELIRHLQKMLGRLIGEDIVLRLALSPDLGRIKADPGQIEQVLINLAVNARDAMHQGGSLVLETRPFLIDEVSVSVHAPLGVGSYVLLGVSDTGMGMSEEVKQHLFEPFFTTKGQGKGTGLGLATVYGIVRQNGGHVQVYSEPGHGTTFKIYLPMIGGEAEAFAPQPSGEVIAGAGELILLVEDEELLRHLVSKGLPELNYRVIAFSRGREALEWLRSGNQKPDMLVTDVVMPEMNGRVLADFVQELMPGLPVLFTSGYTEDAIVSHGVLEEGIRFLPKPYTIQSLAGKIRQALAGRAGV